MKYKLIFFLFFMMPAIAVLSQKPTLRLLSYNIRNGKGMDSQTDYDRTCKVLSNANADVIALQELDSVTRRSNGADVLNILAQKTGMHGVYGAAINYGGGKYGVGILSQAKPLKHFTVPLPGKEEERVLLVAEYESYVVFCTHLSLTGVDRLASMSIIDSVALLYRKPVYLLGDLNATPSTELIMGLKKEWQLLSGENFTFPALAPDRCIDYIFSRNCNRTVQHAVVIEEPLASDHRPVLVELK